ncbi:MAG: alginate lyase family protein [Prolixibacteraceae bacterium]|nr:alginate lyase family protein [Prolixibacteraceae bacterium]
MKFGNFVIISMLLFFLTGCESRISKISFCAWDHEWMQQIKKSCKKGSCRYQGAINNLKSAADGALQKEAHTVAAKKNVPSGVSPNDYLTFPPYWWPDSASHNGLPYIRRYNEINPAHDSDYRQLEMMVQRVCTLSLAWFFSGEKKYAAAAAGQLRVWFIDPRTRMNPNLRYAQSIPGRREGRAAGIVEAQSLASLVDAVLLLNASKAIHEDDFEKIKEWFVGYFNGLCNSQQGSDVENFPNGNALSYDFQVIAIADFLGDSQFVVNKLAQIFPRIDKMIDATGKQPAELRREESFSNSVANIDNFFNIGEIGLKYGVDIFSYKNEAGTPALQSALDFLCGYLGNSNSWQWLQTDNWETAENSLGLLIRRAGRYFGNTEYEIMWEQAFAAQLGAHWNLLVFAGL